MVRFAMKAGEIFRFRETPRVTEKRGPDARLSTALRATNRADLEFFRFLFRFQELFVRCCIQLALLVG